MPPYSFKYVNLYFENKNKLHFNVKQCTWLNSPQSLQKTSGVFKELIGQMKKAKHTTKEQVMHYFIISEVTPTFTFQNVILNNIIGLEMTIHIFPLRHFYMIPK